jgi:ATP-binding cassette, subfamily C (CFTR/MRP), member 1
LADRVIALNEGVVVSDGSFNEAPAESTGISLKQSIEINTHSTLSDTDELQNEINSTEQLSTVVYSKTRSEQVGEQVGEQDVSRRDGTWSVYEYYIKTAGYKTAACFVFAVLVAGFFSNFACESSLYTI